MSTTHHLRCLARESDTDEAPRCRLELGHRIPHLFEEKAQEECVGGTCAIDRSTRKKVHRAAPAPSTLGSLVPESAEGRASNDSPAREVRPPLGTTDAPNYRAALRPDAQAFDEVRIVTVPRFKDSGLSGSEWRTSAHIQFWRKGELVVTKGAQDVERACAHVAYHRAVSIDDGHALFAGDLIHCDQEGCSELALFAYVMTKKVFRDGHAETPDPYVGYPVRCFCEKHKRRGDSSLDDCDKNYTQISLDSLRAEKGVKMPVREKEKKP